MGKVKLYSAEVMEAVRQNLGLESNDVSRDQEIMEMSKKRVFHRYMAWQGISGYNQVIMEALEDIYGVEFKERVG